MPIHVAKSSSGKSGVQWGAHGKVYTGAGALGKARKQALAAHFNGYDSPLTKSLHATAGAKRKGK